LASSMLVVPSSALVATSTLSQRNSLAPLLDHTCTGLSECLR
jgi:hypothetical protein